MAKASLYDTLGVPPGATLAEIRAAHREKVKARHLDKGGKREDFEATQHAWLVLRDAARRAEYDKTGVDPGEPVDNRHAQVLGVLSAAIGSLLQQPLEQIIANPIIKVLGDFLESEIKNLRDQQTEAKKALAKIERVRKRFRRKVAGEDTIGVLFAGHVGGLEQAIAKSHEQIALRVEAKTILADYEFDQEVPIWVGAGGPVTSGYGQSLGSIFGPGWG